jgi:hypothetical protein
MDDNIARLAELQEEEGSGEKRPKQADVLIGIAAAAATLFHSPAPDCDAFADININGHRETHRIRGAAFRQWLRHQYFRKAKAGVNSDALQVATETIAAKAMFEGDEHEVHCRIAGHHGAIYLDIGDEGWKAIKATDAGWDIVADPPVRFQRSPSMRPLPVPERGGSIELLRPFCNLSSAARSSVNWLTIKRYEGAGKHLPSGTVVALNRLVATFENAGIRFDADDAYLDQAAPTIKSTILNDGAAL